MAEFQIRNRKKESTNRKDSDELEIVYENLVGANSSRSKSKINKFEIPAVENIRNATCTLEDYIIARKLQQEEDKTEIALRKQEHQDWELAKSLDAVENM